MPSKLPKRSFVREILRRAVRGEPALGDRRRRPSPRADTPRAIKLRNIALLLEYDGTRYAGFQLQKNALTVQEVLERAVRNVFHETIRVHPAGRTDSGAHARGQVVNFKTTRAIAAEKILPALNSRLPPDIAVRRVWEAGSRFHARFSARAKVYRYSVLNSRVAQPLLRAASYHVRDRLNVARMRRAARLLVGRHDFKAFEGAGNRQAHSVRTLKRVAVSRRGELLMFEVEGNGFLTHMVRNIVGSLLWVGKGKIGVKELRAILDSRDRRRAGPAVPAKGLVLEQVKY